MHDIFISYAKEDKKHAKRIAQALEKEGLDVWWDHDIPTGKNFASVIEKAIDNTKCVLVLWSRHSIISEWVQVEATEGQKRNILVPVRIEDVNIPLAFRMRQTADLIDWDYDASSPNFQELIDDIKLILSENNSETSGSKESGTKTEDRHNQGTSQSSLQKNASDISELKPKLARKPLRNRNNQILGNSILAIVLLVPLIKDIMLFNNDFETYKQEHLIYWISIVIILVILILFNFWMRKKS